MDTLLRIDASARVAGSYSRAVADRLEASWRSVYVSGRVMVRDVAQEPIPHLDEATLQAFWGGGIASTSDTLVAELRQATDLLISTPIYNFGVPAALKAWIDQVVRAGHTFDRTPQGFVPRLSGRRAYVVLAQGGQPGGPLAEEYGLPHLRAVLGLLGWPRVEVVALRGMAMSEPTPGTRLEAALEHAAHIVADRPTELPV